MLPPFDPPSGFGYSPGVLRALWHNQAQRNIDDEDHILVMLKQLRGILNGLITRIENGDEIDSKTFKNCFHVMYGYVVKLTMWRQYYFNDFQPIHLGANRRRKYLQD